MVPYLPIRAVRPSPVLTAMSAIAVRMESNNRNFEQHIPQLDGTVEVEIVPKPAPKHHCDNCDETKKELKN